MHLLNNNINILSLFQMEPKEKQKQIQPLFTILHFNDVYDIQPNKKGTCGIVNFEAYIRKLRAQHPKNLLLFSGDCLSPSILSNVYEGRQMVTALNKLNIDMACYGNHEFDYDQETSQKLTTSCNFPWLLGNIRYKETEFCLGDGIPYLVKQCHGLKIGFFGVGGEDWLGILIDDYEDLLEYDDVGEHSKKMCKILKQEQKCDMIIALTHMRVPQDKKLPFQAVDVDIVLGGHDHVILKQLINGIPVLKSGDNFKTMGIINVYKKQSNPNAEYKCKNYDFSINVVPVPIAEEKDIEKQLKQYVDACMEEYNKNDKLVGYTDAELETRFSNVRTKETNYGDFLADLARTYYDADCCVINAGSIRNDQLIKPGPLNYSVISNLINDVLVVKEIPGVVLLEMLQYACSNLPDTYAGCFLLVSGIKYSYDYRKLPRVQSVEVNGIPLDQHKKYSVVTKFYLSTGGDGFSMMRDCKYLVDQVSGIDTLRLLLKFFKGRDQDEEVPPQKLPQSQKKLSQITTNQDDAIPRKLSSDSALPEQIKKLSRKTSVRMSRIFSLIQKTIEGPDNKKYVVINPKTSNRIISLYP